MPALPAAFARMTCTLLASLAISAAHAQSEQAIELDARQVVALKLITVAAIEAQSLPLSRLPAEIIAPLDATRTVSTPFAGVVASISADEGAQVRAGTPLARVHSRDFLAARADLQRSRSEATLAQSQARRDASLLGEGIIARSRADESKARAADAQARLQQAQESLTAATTPKDGAAGEYELRAPIDGRILQRAITPGQSVAAFETAFTIAAGNAVDLLVQAPLEHASDYAPGLGVILDDGARAEVVAVALATTSGSQSIRLRARLADAGRWHIGQRSQVRLELRAPADAVQVPTTALIASGSTLELFVARNQRYHAVSVERLGGDERTAIVRGALKAGDAVVSSGASALKSLRGE
ncbi:efflux RND transporter periplasmic adaptor subunit [Dokdonella sp.]|uniref:efflux RND transporter periplasmic adaptor subunit n=2 Tax=Dokdonella sp. TaxID=2291710 RepID=UPI0027B97364|nr:efflux RND transporter periplasmic adaptor subunit [Dokdonella sp.]